MLIKTKIASNLINMIKEEEINTFDLHNLLETINHMKKRAFNDAFAPMWFYKYLQAKSLNIGTRWQDLIHKKKLSLINDVHMDILMQIRNLDLLELLDQYNILKSIVLDMSEKELEDIMSFLDYIKDNINVIDKYLDNLAYLLKTFPHFNLKPQENLNREGCFILEPNRKSGIITDGNMQFKYGFEQSIYAYNLTSANIVIEYESYGEGLIDKRNVIISDLDFIKGYVPKNEKEFLKMAEKPQIPYQYFAKIQKQIDALRKEYELLEESKALFLEQKKYLESQYVAREEEVLANLKQKYEQNFMAVSKRTNINDTQLEKAICLTYQNKS